MVQINELLGNGKTVKAVLFFLDDSSEYSQTELMKKIGLAKATAVRVLKNLVFLKIINVRKIGPTNLYSFNQKSEIAVHIKEIRNLVRK